MKRRVDLATWKRNAHLLAGFAIPIAILVFVPGEGHFLGWGVALWMMTTFEHAEAKDIPEDYHRGRWLAVKDWRFRYLVVAGIIVFAGYYAEARDAAYHRQLDNELASICSTHGSDDLCDELHAATSSAEDASASVFGSGDE